MSWWGIAAWMAVNQEAIHGTRPWKVLGEGPQLASVKPLEGPGFNEGKAKAFTVEDVRFTTKGGALYVIVMGAPRATVHVRSLGTAAKLLGAPITGVTQLGSGEKVRWSQTDGALTIEAPAGTPNEIATVFKVSTR